MNLRRYLVCCVATILAVSQCPVVSTARVDCICTNPTTITPSTKDMSTTIPNTTESTSSTTTSTYKPRPATSRAGPAKSTSTPSPTKSTYTPSPTNSTSTPSPTNSTSTPSPTNSTSTPSPTNSTSTPSPTNSTSTPSPTNSTPTPSPTISTSTPSPTNSTSTPSPTHSTSTPSPTNSSSTPSPTNSTYTPSPTNSTSTPSPTNSTSTPSPTNSTSTPSPVNSTSTPSPSNSTYTPSPANTITTSVSHAFRKKRAAANITGFYGPTGSCICDEGPSSVTTQSAAIAKVLSIASIPVNVRLEVKIEKKFLSDLNDKTSKTYKNYTTEFKTKLEYVYRNLTDFMQIDVLGFRKGSTICDYVVVLYPGSIPSVTIQNATDSLKNEHIIGANVTSVNHTIVTDFRQLYRSNPCVAYDCGHSYTCERVIGDRVYCQHLCESQKYKNMCQHSGMCLVDERQELPLCSCKPDDTYIYSGEHCEIANEPFGLSKTTVIAIAAGCGGGVVLILTIVIVVVVVKRTRNQKMKQRKITGEYSKSVSMDDLQIDRMNGSRSSNEFLHRPRTRASDNPYHSGLPETKYMHGREHKVVKDGSGEETYLYQPSNLMHPMSRSRIGSTSSTNSRTTSLYDYIDIPL